MPDSTVKLRQFGLALHGVGLLVTLGIVASLYAIGSVSFDARSRETATTIAAKRQFLDSAGPITKSYEELKQQLQNEETRLSELFERIPQHPQESDFLAQLAKLARQSNVTIRQFSRGEATKEATYSGMEVQLTAQASHASVCRFLSGLADLRRLCHVRKLSISSGGEDQADYPVDMTLRIFFAPVRETTT